MKLRVYAISLLLGLSGAGVWAQGPGPDGPRPPADGPPPGDAMAEQMFPPELVMHNQRALGLTEDQQKTIREAVKSAQGKFTDLQWQQADAAEALQGLVKQERVDETQALAQLDKLLGFENQIKHAQLGLMLRIKNTLTAEQQQKLRELKRNLRPARAGGPRGGMAPRDGGPRPGGSSAGDGADKPGSPPPPPPE